MFLVRCSSGHKSSVQQSARDKMQPANACPCGAIIQRGKRHKDLGNGEMDIMVAEQDQRMKQAKASPSRLTYSWTAKAAGAPGQRRAILLVGRIPSAMEIHRMLSETNAVARERYQYTFGSVPASDAAMLGSQLGIAVIAASKPTIMASMNHQKKLDIDRGFVFVFNGSSRRHNRFLTGIFHLLAVDQLTVIQNK